jgi:hypothetical protein
MACVGMVAAKDAIVRAHFVEGGIGCDFPRESCPAMAIPLLDHMIRDAVDQTVNLSKRLRIMFAVAPQMKRSSWSMA